MELKILIEKAIIWQEELEHSIKKGLEDKLNVESLRSDWRVLRDLIEIAEVKQAYQENPPLTLQQLNKMTGMPVYVTSDDVQGWGFVERRGHNLFVFTRSGYIVADVDCRCFFAKKPTVVATWLSCDNPKHKKCSNCEVTHMIAQYPAGNASWCPNCGAFMSE